MADNPTISVIVVGYNSGNYLVATVLSILQSSLPVQIVIVDNASSDNSVESLVARFGDRIEIIHNGRNKGFSTAVNQAAAICHGDFLLLLNPDCIVQPHTVATLAQTLSTHAEAAAVGGLVFNFDGTEQRGCRRREPTPARSFTKSIDKWLFRQSNSPESVDMIGEPMPGQIIPVDAVSGAFMMVRRTVFESLGGMDENYFLHCEDLDFCRRLRDAGHQILFNPAVSIFHSQGVSGRGRELRVEKYKHQGMLRYYKKFYQAESHWLQTIFIQVGILIHFGLVTAKRLLMYLSIFFRRETSAAKPPSPEQLIEWFGAPSSPQIIVTGASSQVGNFLIPRLLASHHSVLAISRRPPSSGTSVARWRHVDYLTKAPVADIGPVAALVHLAPIWIIEHFDQTLNRLSIKNIIALSSTSAVSKQHSPDENERRVSERLRTGEGWLQNEAKQKNRRCVILRPTLIYGTRNNQNIGTLSKLIKWFQFFPLLGNGQGKRQPVHADDLARSCVVLLARTGNVEEVYALSGATTLTYRQMLIRVFDSQGQSPRFVNLPKTLMRFVMKVLSKLPRLGFLSAQMVDRSEQDLCFNHSLASKDFQYAPRPFNL